MFNSKYNKYIESTGRFGHSKPGSNRLTGLPKPDRSRPGAHLPFHPATDPAAFKDSAKQIPSQVARAGLLPQEHGDDGAVGDNGGATDIVNAEKSELMSNAYEDEYIQQDTKAARKKPARKASNKAKVGRSTTRPVVKDPGKGPKGGQNYLARPADFLAAGFAAEGTADAAREAERKRDKEVLQRVKKGYL